MGVEQIITKSNRLYYKPFKMCFLPSTFQYADVIEVSFKNVDIIKLLDLINGASLLW